MPKLRPLVLVLLLVLPLLAAPVAEALRFRAVWICSTEKNLPSETIPSYYTSGNVKRFLWGFTRLAVIDMYGYHKACTGKGFWLEWTWDRPGQVFELNYTEVAKPLGEEVRHGIISLWLQTNSIRGHGKVCIDVTVIVKPEFLKKMLELAHAANLDELLPVVTIELIREAYAMLSGEYGVKVSAYYLNWYSRNFFYAARDIITGEIVATVLAYKIIIPYAYKACVSDDFKVFVIDTRSFNPTDIEKKSVVGVPMVLAGRRGNVVPLVLEALGPGISHQIAFTWYKYVESVTKTCFWIFCWGEDQRNPIQALADLAIYLDPVEPTFHFSYSLMVTAVDNLLEVHKVYLYDPSRVKVEILMEPGEKVVSNITLANGLVMLATKKVAGRAPLQSSQIAKIVKTYASKPAAIVNGVPVSLSTVFEEPHEYIVRESSNEVEIAYIKTLNINNTIYDLSVLYYLPKQDTNIIVETSLLQMAVLASFAIALTAAIRIRRKRFVVEA